RAADNKTAFTHRRRNRPHRRAADPKKMEVTRRFALAHPDSLHAKKPFANGCGAACRGERSTPPSSRAQARDLTYFLGSHQLYLSIQERARSFWQSAGLISSRILPLHS